MEALLRKTNAKHMSASDTRVERKEADDASVSGIAQPFSKPGLQQSPCPSMGAPATRVDSTHHIDLQARGALRKREGPHLPEVCPHPLTYNAILPRSLTKPKDPAGLVSCPAIWTY